MANSRPLVALHVYNTRTRNLDLFTPQTAGVVRIYTCGLTVYAPMHIGHARTYCFWDVFRRYLEYRGYHVMSVINYTDIDDRIMKKADETTGCLDIAESAIAAFRRDCRSLRIKDYAAYTRATDFIEPQVDMVKQLLDKGHAYVVDGEVLYDVQSFEGYGKLSGNTLEGGQAGASGRLAEDAGRKKHPADFTLWKPSDPGQPTWQTGQEQWPSGRPGWHIECSAMSSVMLGDNFDVHGGAIDNLFPHHENEVAQSEALCCNKPWVGYWMHPEHLDLRGIKMSKSLGNVIGVPNLLDTHRYDEIRWFFAATHYRTKLAFTNDLVSAASEGFKKITRAIKILETRLNEVDEEARAIPVASRYASLREGDEAVPRERESFLHGEYAELSKKFITRFIEGMDDDMGCPRATAAMFDYVNELFAAGIEHGTDHPSMASVYRCLVRHLYVLGVEVPNEALYPQLAADCFPAAGGGEAADPYKAVIDRLLEARADARKSKDFAKSDMIRDVLQAAGVQIEDTAKGARWELE